MLTLNLFAVLLVVLFEFSELNSLFFSLSMPLTETMNLDTVSTERTATRAVNQSTLELLTHVTSTWEWIPSEEKTLYGVRQKPL